MTDFSESAGDISVDGTMLTAELNMIEEGTRGRQGLNLNDRIGNDNGQLVVSSSPYGGSRGGN